MEKDPNESVEVHAFVCTRVKEGGESCGPKGSAELRERLKKWVKTEGLKGRVKITASLCLGHCEKGITVCIYPQGKWYFKVDKDSDFENLQKEILALLEAK
jgi:(2Fe-2S) ferredoxin